MIVDKNVNGSVIVLKLRGRLDKTTASALEASLEGCTDGVREIVLDFGEVDEISSAGLRVLLKIRKSVASKDRMKLINVGGSVMEVFELTGFSDILTVE